MGFSIKMTCGSRQWLSKLYCTTNCLFSCSWIQLMEGSKLKVVTAGDPNFMRTLESSVRVGEAMLLKVRGCDLNNLRMIRKFRRKSN